MDLQVLHPNSDEKLNLNRKLHVLIKQTIPRVERNGYRGKTWYHALND